MIKILLYLMKIFDFLANLGLNYNKDLIAIQGRGGGKEERYISREILKKNIKFSIGS